MRTLNTHTRYQKHSAVLYTLLVGHLGSLCAYPAYASGPAPAERAGNSATANDERAADDLEFDRVFRSDLPPDTLTGVAEITLKKALDTRNNTHTIDDDAKSKIGISVIVLTLSQLGMPLLFNAVGIESYPIATDPLPMNIFQLVGALSAGALLPWNAIRKHLSHLDADAAVALAQGQPKLHQQLFRKLAGHRVLTATLVGTILGASLGTGLEALASLDSSEVTTLAQQLTPYYSEALTGLFATTFAGLGAAISYVDKQSVEARIRRIPSQFIPILERIHYADQSLERSNQLLDGKRRAVELSDHPSQHTQYAAKQLREAADLVKDSYGNAPYNSHGTSLDLGHDVIRQAYSKSLGKLKKVARRVMQAPYHNAR